MSDLVRDPARLAALAHSALTVTGREEAFDRPARLAARLLDTPVAAISVVDDERQYLKGAAGADIEQMSLSHSLCRFVVAQAAPLAVADARQHPDLREHPAVTQHGVVAYCGVPVTDGHGHVLGCFCAADGRPREWSEADLALLGDLAAAVATELELRTANRMLAAREQEIRLMVQSAHDPFSAEDDPRIAHYNQSAERHRARLAQVVESTHDAVITVDRDGTVTSWNAGAEMLYGFTAHEMLGRSDLRGDIRPHDAAHLAITRRALAGEHVTLRAVPVRKRDGETIYVDMSVAPLRDPDGLVAGATSIARDATEARRLELELEQSEERFRKTFDAAPIGVALVGVNGRWLRVNQALCEILGYSEREMLSTSFQAITHPDDLQEDLQLVRELLDGARFSFQREKRYLHKQGDIVWAKLSVALVRDEDGVPMHFVSHIEDVTPTKLAELAERVAHAARTEAENRHRVLLSSLPDTLVALFDRNLRCVLVQGALEPLGIRAEDLQGRYLVDLVSPDRYRVLEPHVTRALNGQSGSLEYASGDARTYHADIAPYRSDGETVTGVFTVWRDISERLERERTNRVLATIVEQSGDAILAKDRDGVITEWNRGAEELYGYTAAEAVGRPISILVPAERRGEDRQLLARALAGRTVSQFQTVRLRRDGTRVDVSVSISPLHDGDGSIVGASVIARDVTERQQMVDELRASREQALEASRLKSEFVANMSHEIRTPLNGVVSMAELLLDTPLSPEQGQYAQIALTSAEALMRVINDILDFSKIEAGKLEIVQENFSVREAVQDVVEIVGPKARERGVAMSAAVGDQVAEVVRADGNRVRQVLMNLLSNAVKFTNQGEVTVDVRVTAPAPDRGQRLRLEVSDTGIGISPERLLDLFQPFSQGDATTTRRYGGTGLGLCISKQLVELMGGEIGCESTPGEGSRFWFELPYQPGESDEARAATSDLTGIRVLIVDGDASHRRWVEDRLAAWGISPATAGDADTALQLLRRAAETGRPYETALIALELPGQDGLELARTVTGIPALRSTRLILHSAAGVDRAAAGAAGVDDQLVRPLRQSRLYNQLLAAVHRERPGVPTAAPAPPSLMEDGVRVLVAEDNEVNRFAAIRLLQTFNFTVDVARDGGEAIAMTARRNYAVVFMDCQMPEVDGYTATRVIRRRENGGERLPIIALTAHALDGDREKCLEAGMDDYVSKPLRLQTIRQLMERLPALAPPPEPAEDHVFDPSALSEIGDRETEGALAMMFLDQASERVPALRTAIETGDSDGVHALAHGLKGSAATVGAHRMSELSRELCEVASGRLTPAAADLHEQLAGALVQTRAAVEDYLSR